MKTHLILITATDLRDGGSLDPRLSAVCPAITPSAPSPKMAACHPEECFLPAPAGKTTKDLNLSAWHQNKQHAFRTHSEISLRSLIVSGYNSRAT